MLAPSTNSLFALRTTCVADLLLIALLAVGCAGSVSQRQSSPQPALSLSATAFNFATVIVGQTATQTLSISNTGSAPLQISSLSVSNAEFSISGPSVPRTVLPGGSLAYTLTFSPTTAGSVSATVQFTTNASSTPAFISLAGIGQQAFANLVITPSSINFGNTTLNSTQTQSITLQNTGNINLTIQGVTVAGVGFGYSGLSPGLSLVPNQTVTFQVWFSPKVAGPASATVQIFTNPSITAPSVALSGSGQQTFANLVITPSSINFGNIALNSTTTQNVTIQNTGNINLTIQGITVAGAGFSYSGLSSGLSLTPNQTVTFQVWFSPRVAGPASATVTLLSPNISSPGRLDLSGDGISTTSPSPTPTQHTVHLSWNASTSVVIGYRVYRSEVSGGPYNPLNGTAITLHTFDDSTVASGTTYYYVVTAVDATGLESVYSNEATAVVPSP